MRQQLTLLTGLLSNFGAAGMRGLWQDQSARESLLRQLNPASAKGMATIYLVSAAFSPDFRAHLVQELREAGSELGAEWKHEQFVQDLSRFAERAAPDEITWQELNEEIGHQHHGYGLLVSPPPVELALAPGDLRSLALARSSPDESFDGRRRNGQPALNPGLVEEAAAKGEPRHMALLQQPAAKVPKLRLSESLSPHGGTHKGWIRAFYFLDERTIITGGMDSTIRLMDIKTGQLLRELKGHAGVIRALTMRSPQDKRILFSADDEGMILRWDLAGNGQRNPTQLQEPMGQAVRALSVSPDGRFLVSGSQDGTILVWDAVSGKRLRRIFKGQTVYALSFSLDGESVFAACDDGVVRRIRTDTGAVISEFIGHTKAVRALALSPDGELLMTSSEDGSIQAWDVQTAQERHRYRVKDDWVRSIGFTPDGGAIVTGNINGWVDLMVLGEDGTIKEVRFIYNHDDVVYQTTLDPSGKILVSAGRDMAIGVYDDTMGTLSQLRGSEGPVHGLAVLDNKLIGVSHDGRLLVWESPKEKPLKLDGHKASARALAVAPNGAVASGGDDKIILLRKPGSTQPLVLTGHTERIRALAFSPDQRLLASGGDDRVVHLWDAETGEKVLEIKQPDSIDVVHALAFSPDGRRLLTAGRDGIVRVWDAETGTPIAEWEKKHTGYIRTLSFSQDGRFLATGGRSGTIWLWDAQRGEALGPLRGHTDDVNSVQFDPSQRYLLSASDDSTIRFWDLESRTLLRTFTVQRPVTSAVFGPDGSILAIDDWQKLYRFDAEEPLDPATTWRMMLFYVLASNFALMAVEMMSSASLPLYLEKTFGNMSLMAKLSVAIMAASVFGSQLSALIVNRFGLKSSLLGLLGATFVFALAIGGVANVGVMTIPLLVSLFIAFRMMHSALLAAETVVIPNVFGRNQRAMEDLRGMKQSWGAVASALTQTGAAALVILLGTAKRNFIIAPFFYLAAIVVLWFTLKIPQQAYLARRHSENIPRQIGRGFNVVMHDPVLKRSAMLSALITMFKWLTFLLLPQLFAKFVIGASADPSLVAPIIALIIGLFSFGGLYAGKLVSKQAGDLKRKHGGDTPTINEASRQSTMRWLKYGALSFLLVGVLALPLPTIGPLISQAAVTSALAGLVPAGLPVAVVLGFGMVLALWRPTLGLAVALVPILLFFPLNVILPALGFFAFGILQVIATLKNDSFFDAAVQERSPTSLADARAFGSAFAMFTGVLGLLVLNFFATMPGLWPFILIFAALAVPTAIVFYLMSRKLDALSKPSDPMKPKD